MKRGGFTIIATLITVAIICILMVVMMQGMGDSVPAARPDGRGKTIPGAAKAQAEDQVCLSNLSQVRQGIQIAMVGTDTPPPTIEDARIGQQFYSCPLGHEPYKYDPQTGRVQCVHPGHENY